MPLHTHRASADIIIHELSQPHRFTHVANCKCGFFASCFSEVEAVEAAKSHLQIKHGITDSGLAAEEGRIYIAKFKTGGGLVYDQLLPLLLKEEAGDGAPLPPEPHKPPSVAAQVATMTGKPAVKPPTILKPTPAAMTPVVDVKGITK
jgi:hypothetical protein